ncbi:chromosome partitioning protein ParB [Loigolactobacillus zhaoyuanensis]|uniref:chromosome partitioning protein ParB n=1 Tax=Loigolactobacillus zhaoyuanensis TaxID=2486017 RepID=UPI001CDBFF7D|nr:chromosome partitioning protein ParB [Loigolactobacillus zhaoyuanensis]
MPATKVWQDACEKVEADNLYIMMNDNTLVNLVRHQIVRIDMTKLETPGEKRAHYQDQFFNTVSSLANIGL